MSTTTTVILLIVLVILAAAAFGAWSVLRRRSLRQRFGPEYDRVIEEYQDRPTAENELRDRERRHAALELKELTPKSRARYTANWQELQVHFIAEPQTAVNEADDLVTELIAERGYPTGDYDEQLAQLSVDHANTLESYREAHEISLKNRRGEADTEELRQAVVHYRALVAELLGEQPVPLNP
ncbi:MAG TPA: hypothetical protein DGG94_14365 [Micromonosporaceae bacterium]|nr:hypothetical protein [Micromonosporaceae bacterium]